MIRCLHELKAISVFLFKNEFTYNLVNMSHAMADISFLNFHKLWGWLSCKSVSKYGVRRGVSDLEVV